MNNFFVLTAIGADRPGLVEEITAFLADRSININIEDSRMAVLGGEFAIILLASGEESSIKKLEASISKVEKITGLVIQIKPTIDPVQRKIKPSVPYRIIATSMDHPGIVHEITRILHEHLINIETLDTHITHAPISGVPIFNMRCNVNIPAKEKLAVIKTELKELGDNLNVDIEFEGIEAF